MSTLLFMLALLGQQSEPSTLERTEREVAAVAEAARKSVVGITATYAAQMEPGVQIQESIKLSGIVYSADGVIITDGTALDKAVEIKVRLPDGREVEARLISIDRRTSIAVLRVAAEKLTPAQIADAKDVRQGIYGIVIGNTMGLASSVEIGFVSGLGRSVQVGGRRYEDMIQLTTAVSSGDCGGFVANSRGHLIGLVHSSWQGEAGDIESLGILKLFGKDYADLLPGGASKMTFATPASTVKFVVERILKHGRMVRGWMGMTARPLDDATREQFAVAQGEGCEVWSVDPQGPAAKVLRRRDVLLSVDGKSVTDVRALKRWVTELEAEKTVRVVFLRGGQRREADVIIRMEP